jgi:hypothetical protein
LLRKPEGRPLDVSGRIILNLIVGWGGMDWIELAEDRDQWSARENGNEFSSSIKCFEIL